MLVLIVSVYLESLNKGKPAKRRGVQTFKSLLYAVLSIGVGGFFLWLWLHSTPPPVPAPVASTPVPAMAAAPSNPPPSVNTPPPKPVPRPIPPSGERPVATTLEAQIALARQGISPGSIDGVLGSQTQSALIAFQNKEGITPSGSLDTDTRALLLISPPATVDYMVSSNDLARLMTIPKTWLEKSQQPRLDFENITELLGEKGFASPQLIRNLNPNIVWSNVTPGTMVTIPQVQYPTASAKVALLKISLQACVLEAFDSETNLLVHFPCSIGRLAQKRPVGELHVATVAMNPNYTFNPAVFPESSEAQALGRKLIIPPGPNNPVGVAWIGLDRPGYGIHGTPAPEQVGRTESHGCFRLANWNADYLARRVSIGLPVLVEP